MTAAITTPRRSCLLCDTPTVMSYCSPECAAEGAALIDFQRMILHLAAAPPDCDCRACAMFTAPATKPGVFS